MSIREQRHVRRCNVLLKHRRVKRLVVLHVVDLTGSMHRRTPRVDGGARHCKERRLIWCGPADAEHDAARQHRRRRALHEPTRADGAS